ncbi:MAG TPA: hypothetical protein VHO90_05330 [Bacteroidales bacterium]|nr:hypothetical protein [Bacteroidales bacterium]
MNEIVKGVTKIRNAMLMSVIIVAVTVAMMLITRAINSVAVQIMSMILMLSIVFLGIWLIVQFYKGINILRQIDLVAKLNQRLDEMKCYFWLNVIAVSIAFFILIVGALTLTNIVVVIGQILIVPSLILSWLMVFRLIQVNGILGVYSRNSELVEKSISLKKLFYFQIGNAIFSYAVSFFSAYLGTWAIYLVAASAIFSFYFLTSILGILGLTITIFKNYS